MKELRGRVEGRLAGELMTVKVCKEKGTGIIHTEVMAQQAADTLSWVLAQMDRGVPSDVEGTTTVT